MAANAAADAARGSAVHEPDEEHGGRSLRDVEQGDEDPSAFPCARRTFVAPALPEPSVRMSLPVFHRTRRTAKEIDPSR